MREELTESERNLQDALKNLDAIQLERDKLKLLIEQLSDQNVELNKKDKEIGILMKQHNDLVHKNKEYEKTIASLKKDLKHCKCKKFLIFT